MAVKRIAAETLIELAVATLREELAPELPAGSRYGAAMVANALEIARREILADGETAHWALLDSIYEGDGSARQLAADIRSGNISDTSHPDLRQRLRAVVVDELRVRNPRFLASRASPTERA